MTFSFQLAGWKRISFYYIAENAQSVELGHYPPLIPLDADSGDVLGECNDLVCSSDYN